MSVSRGRTQTRCSTVALSVTMLAAVAHAGGVVVVRTSDSAPYKAVESSFTSALGQPTQVIALGGESGREQVKTALAGSPSLVFTIGPDAAKAVLDLGSNAPTLYALVPSPGRVGLDARAAGVSMFASPVNQVKAIRELLPQGKRIGVLYDPTLTAALVQELDAAADSHGATLVKKEVTAKKDVITAARDLLGKIDVLLLVPDTTVISGDTFKFMAQTSLEAKVPMVAFSEGMAKAGAVLAIEAPYEQMGKKAADAAKRMLAGGAAAKESPDGTLFINGKSAELLGVTVPAGLKARAAKVFE